VAVANSARRLVLIGVLVTITISLAAFLILDPIVQQNFHLWVRIAVPLFLAIGVWGTLSNVRLLRVFGWIGIGYYMLASTGLALPPEITRGIRAGMFPVTQDCCQSGQ